MRTSKPFSTISYNTKEFLIAKLNNLITRNVIDFYAFVEHIKEDDEKKNHIHLYVVPSTLIDTKQFIDELKELQTNENGEMTLPLGCMPCTPSKFDDWFLYCKHDVNYLRSKGQVRMFHYEQKEFVSSNDDYLNELSHTINYNKFSKFEQISDYAKQGFTYNQVLAMGLIPVQLTKQYEQVFNAIRLEISNKTYRNGKPNHEHESEDLNEKIWFR